MLSAELTVRYDNEERSYTLNPDVPYGVGRSPQNAICVPSDAVSRNHLLIKTNDNGNFCVFDLGSRNGTLLNDRMVSASVELHDRDVIRIGDVTLLFTQKSVRDKTHGHGLEDHARTVATFALTQLTVLVVDIRGFTTLSRQIGDSRIAEIVSAYNFEAGRILDNSRTWTMKFIGDAVMAIWLRKKEEQPARTLVTAFHVFEEIYTFVSGLQSQFGLEAPVSIGGGINTGYATVGNIGSGSNADYTALGDSVNMAFRLEGATRGLACDLTYGPEVHSILRESMVHAGVGKRNHICLKGYAEECDVYSMQIDEVRRYLKLFYGQTKAE